MEEIVTVCDPLACLRHHDLSAGRYLRGVHHVLEPFGTWLRKDDWPRQTCTRCGNPTLEPERLTHHKDQSSDELVSLVKRNLEPPGELRGTFDGNVKCARASCDQSVSIAGDWRYVVDFDEENYHETFIDEYLVRYMNPAPLLVHLPPRTPVAVAQAVRSASDVVWLNPNAAANLLRQAVEELLTARKVKRQTLTPKKKQQRLTTHQRLVLFRAQQPEVADVLEAVKWIGNSGSHDSELTIADVLNGAAYLALALRRLYDTSDAELLAQVKAVNKRRGPVRKN